MIHTVKGFGIVKKQKVKVFSHVQLFVTPWTVAYQAPPSMGFSKQEYWSGVPLPSLRPPYLPPNKPVFAAQEATVRTRYGMDR